MAHYMDLKQAPNREERLGSCIAYGGTLCDFKEKAGCGGVDDAKRGFSQGSICMLLPAMAMINSLPGNVTIVHAAVGCGVCSQSQNANARSGSGQRFGAVKDAIWVSTALDESDVIGGGETKLKAAIIEVDRKYRPKTITVVTACVPAIIGDDVDTVIEDLQAEVTATIIAVHCEGFKTKIWATAYDAVYHGLSKSVLADPEEETKLFPDELEELQEKAKYARTVNLMNVSSMGRGDELELTRYLSAMGLEANLFPVFAETDDAWKVKHAALSVSTCPTHDDYFLTYLEEAFGIPYLLAHMPIGISNTDAWITDIAKFFGYERMAEKFIENEHAKLDKALEKYRKLFAGKRVFVSAGEFRALATANLLAELGFEIVGVRSFHHDAFAEGEYVKLAEKTGDFIFNIANCQPFEEANLLKKLKPDLFLGHWNGNSTAAKLGIPSHVIYNTGLAYIGYKGAFEIARRLARQLTNNAFASNLSGYAKLPYKEDWYGQDAFKYIQGTEEVAAHV